MLLNVELNSQAGHFCSGEGGNCCPTQLELGRENLWVREAPPQALPLPRCSWGPRSAAPGSLCIFAVKGEPGKW